MGKDILGKYMFFFYDWIRRIAHGGSVVIYERFSFDFPDDKF